MFVDLKGLRNVGKLGKKVTETEFEKYYQTEFEVAHKIVVP